MSKDHILFGDDIRQKLLNGANKLADDVASTLIRLTQLTTRCSMARTAQPTRALTIWVWRKQ